MSACSSLKAYIRKNEHLADVFSFSAILILFASLWLSIEYYSSVLIWLHGNTLLNVPLFLMGAAADITLILMLLSLGAAPNFAEDDKCFRTFAGRRQHQGSVIKVFDTWLNHMEKHNSHKHR